MYLLDFVNFIRVINYAVSIFFTSKIQISFVNKFNLIGTFYYCQVIANKFIKEDY